MRRGGGKVVVYSGRRRVGAMHVKPGHRGRIALLPGNYSLGLDNRPPTQLLGCQPKLATVRASETTNYTLSYGCDVP
ncbi:MAG TPA: hypothetical protein VGH79_11425 [Gaiellaceae bacterium]